MQELMTRFMEGLGKTSWLEYVAVVAGIVSVWFSKKENILVYPVGLVNTIIYVFLSFKYQLFGESAVNVYYSIVSIYGWILWNRKDLEHRPVLHITYSRTKEWVQQLSFFLILYVIIFFALNFLKNAFYPGAIPWADAFASATAFTGMWLMARKKVESWLWWIATNCASIPLFFVKGLVVTSLYYVILLILAVSGLMEWMARANRSKAKQQAQ